jgi:hypothetical protein
MVDELQPVLIEWFDEHHYKIMVKGSPQYFPSVTTKLGIIDKPFLAKWRGDIGNREADFRMYEAGQRGKRIHWAYETALKGGCVIYDPWQNPTYTQEGIDALKVKFNGNLAILRTQDEMFQVDKLKRQFEALNPKILGIEETVYDVMFRDAGTIDNILYIEEGNYLIAGSKPIHLHEGIYINDLKTGKVVGEDTWLQLSAYAVMWEQIHGVQVTGALITHTAAVIKGGISGLKTLVRERDQLRNEDYVDYRHAAALWERNHADDQPQTYEFPSLIQFNKKEK